MTETNKQRLMAVIFGVTALVIIWLLMRHVPVTETGASSAFNPTGTTVPPSGGIDLPNINIQGNTYTIQGATPEQLALSLVYGGGPQVTGSSCDCGCDANSPVNTAIQGVATFLNQYAAGATAVANNALQSAWDGLPDWMTQYINSGGLSV